MVSKDRELLAISSIIDLLKPLDQTERSRVLEYVLKRLEMGAVSSTQTASTNITGIAEPSASGTFGVTDIRSLTAQKQPRSANEMVALIAYYLSELAPDVERSTTVNVETIRKYFKMAAFPMPRVPKNALTNATAAGYPENVSRGEYRLNPVGYNLVVHGLPRSGKGDNSSLSRRMGTRRKKRK
jgi:hypothetical protein